MIENFRMQVFRAVAEQASFRKASEILRLSQPAVSQHVQALEEELGLRLFDRSGNRVRLTAAGDTLLLYARKAAALEEQARRTLALEQGDGGGGDLRLGASTTVAQYILPRILGPFLKQHPRVNLSVMSGNTEKVVEWVVGNDIHLGILEGPALRKDVKTERFLSDRMVLIVGRGHEWSSAAAMPVAALAGMPLLMREHGSGSRRVVEAALRRAGLRGADMRILMQLDSTEAIVSGVEAGLGIGFVSEWAIGKEMRLGTVREVTLHGVDMTRDLTLVRPMGPLSPGAPAAFRRFALAQERHATHPKQARR